jgi:hypothetical protein
MEAFRKVVLGAVIALLFVAVATGTARADLVANGGFETGNLNGWTFTPASTGSDFLVAGHVGGILPNSGNYLAAFGAGGSSDDTIAQTVTTVPGQWYTLSFALTHNSNDNKNNFNASWNGVSVLALNNANSFGWTRYSYTVQATASTTTISFAGRENVAWYGLDGVSVASVSAPLPPALLLFSPSLIGIAALRRRFKKQAPV